MKNRLVSEARFLVGTVAAAAVGVILGSGHELFQDRRPPLSALELVALDSPVAAGGVLTVRAHRTKVRDCPPVTSLRTATDMRTQRTFALPASVNPGGPVGEAYVDIVIDTSSLLPGRYMGRTQSIYPCPDRTYYYDAAFQFDVVSSK